MFGTNIKLGSNSQSVQFNTPSTGMMQRSHPKSIFIRFQKGSDFEKMVFPCDGKSPYIKKFDFGSEGYDEFKDTKGKIEVTVLQILVFGNDYFLCEVVENSNLKEEQPK